MLLGGDVAALFPYLSTDMKPHERDNLIYRLKDETSKIQDHFISLELCLKKTLKQSEHSSKDVIDVLTGKHPNLQTVFKKCKTIDKIFKKGRKYWSYFDYEPIQSLITCLFGKKHNLRTRLTEYFEHFKSFASRRVAECPSTIHGKRKEDEKVLVFKIEEITYQGLTMNELKLLCFRLNSAIGSYHLSLLSTSDSCIQLTFRTHLQRKDKKFELSKKQQEALRDVGVISVSYGALEYNLVDYTEMQVKYLQKNFNIIVDQTYYSIIHRKKLETDEFLANLVRLPIEHRDIHKEFFKSLYFEIEEYKNMSSIWHRLNTYWDFLNYTLIENLVKEFGDSDLISRMQDYKKDLKEFRHKTRLCDFAKYHTEYTKQVTEGDLKEFVVKLKNCKDEYSLEDLEKLKKEITHQFLLPSFLMTIRALGNNPLIITWSIPTLIATSLQRNLENIDIREFCKENGIESIHLDGKEILYSPSKKYGAYLKDLYSTKEGKNLAPFKLAMIKKQKISRRESDVFTKNTFRGDQDDVIYKKCHTTEYELCRPTHYTDFKMPRLVLIEGAPGVGKTTFSEQYCYKWSQGKCLNDHTLLVLLPLRDNSVRSAKTVSDLFQHPQLTQDIAQEVLKSQGEGVALWLEAWDELEKSMREESSLFLDLVHGCVLPKATVIITGRPWAIKKIRDSSDITVDQHIEIVSTPKIQFSRVLREERLSTENRKKFIDYVHSNPSVKASMNTPVTANILAEVFQWSKDIESLPPTTMTKLYTAYTCKLLMEHLSRKMADGKKACKILSLEDVPPDVEKELEAICQLAWEGIVEQKLTFASDAVSVDTLGLMHAVKELYRGEDGQLSYHFIHLTLQEFLSAYHISQLPLDRQQQVIQDHVKVGHLKTVVRFYFGLCKPNDFTSSMISNSISDESSSCYHWLFEMEDPKQISNILSDKSVSVRSSYEWSPLDYYCLGYCISHSQCQWELDFEFASMGDEGVEIFCNGTLSNRQATWNGKIMKAKFFGNEITEEGIKSLLKVSPQMLQAIVKLQLKYNKLNAMALGVFSKVIPKMTSLRVLNLADNPIGDGGAVELIRTLCHCKTPLRHLILDDTSIGESDCASLTILISSTDLEKLDVSNNRLSSNSVTSIMNGILQNNTIRTLRMSSSQFSVDNCTSLSSILQQPMCQLRMLYIAKCNIDSGGALQLAAGLTSNQSLELISISDNPIGDTGAAALCEAINNNTLLQTLDMSSCRITSEGFIEIDSSSLQKLEIRGNHLGLEGAKAVSKMIIKCKILREVDLNFDDSLEDGVDTIISSLQSNTSLEKLNLPSKFARPAADPRVQWL